jgi:dihydrofolate reductase
MNSLGKPLPLRQNIVLTRNLHWQAADAITVNHLPQALAACGDAPVAWIIGGAQLYTQALPWVQECHITEIHANFAGDAWFPALSTVDWLETERCHHLATPPSQLAFDTVTYRRHNYLK